MAHIIICIHAHVVNSLTLSLSLSLSLCSVAPPLPMLIHLIAPPTQVRLVDVHPDKLTFNWRPSAASLNYTINSTCGTCPNVTNTAMVTCSGLSLSTTLTMCTFSICRMACGTIGSPSLPIVVTLGGNSLCL